MSERTCHNCVFSCCDPDLWLRCVYAGEPLLPQCANHPQWPGQMHEVPGIPCRHYRPKPILPQGDNVRLIPLGDGAYAYVDAADYEWLSQWTWHLKTGYAVRHEKDRLIFMHREIMQPPEGMVVDHIDGNRINDCRSNLRVCTPAENRRNRRKRCNSRFRFKGVWYEKTRRKWRARCSCDGRCHQLGSFDSEIEAARAYDYAAVAAFGPYARLNLPEDWPPARRAELYAQRDAAKRENDRGQKTEDGRAKPRA